MVSWGSIIYFYHLLIGHWNFGKLLVVQCTVNVHSPYLWTNFEGVGFISNLVDGEEIKTYKSSLLMVFIFRLKVHTTRVLIYLPLLSFPLIHSPTLSCWWRTCWSGACTLLSIFDSQDWVYDVWIFNLISIWYLSRNIINPYVKGLHSHALEWLVFMYFASILKELYNIFV